MHELSIALSIVEEAEQIRKQEAASKVLRVHLRLGTLSGVEQEPLVFSFPLAAAGTGAAEAELIIKNVPTRLSCSSCGAAAAPRDCALICSACGSSSVEIIEGQELILESLELE